MTKTLTEQMKTKNGAWYYVKTKEWGICHWLLFPDTLDIEKDIVKVLAAVPSYKEYKKLRKLPLKCFELENDNSALLVINKDMCIAKERLEKQLTIATKALKYYDGLEDIIVDWKLLAGQEPGTARKALKEIEEVK